MGAFIILGYICITFLFFILLVWLYKYFTKDYIVGYNIVEQDVEYDTRFIIIAKYKKGGEKIMNEKPLSEEEIEPFLLKLIEKQPT